VQTTLPARKSELNPEWQRMLSEAEVKRYRIGLARLGRYASAAGLHPMDVDDSVIDASLPRFAAAHCTRTRTHCTGTSR